ncbi:MAG: ATPase, partial [Promicromonosporaceae bacterium]|nr:ATPase [Promicromonosporaceae bacterium]
MSLRDDVAPEVTFESTTTFVTPARGLSAAQVAEREAAGLTNDPGRREGRTFGQIVRANVFTPINAILSVLLAVILATGRWTNALFGFVILSNSVIGIIQELQSRRVLDKLAVLNQQPVAVVRESEVVLLDSDRVVLDELIQVKSGDQVPADGLIQGADGLEVDESLLTGESDPVPKQPGDAMKSGSIVVAGQGRFQATAVGADSYAARVTADAQRFSLTHSELRAGTDRLLKVIALIMVVVAPLIVWRQFASPDNPGWREA